MVAVRRKWLQACWRRPSPWQENCPAQDWLFWLRNATFCTFTNNSDIRFPLGHPARRASMYWGRTSVRTAAWARRAALIRVLRKSPASVHESRLTSTRLLSPKAPHGCFVFLLTVLRYEIRIFKCQI